MQSTVVWFRFEAFPRREKSFHVRIYQRNNSISGFPESLGEFVIANPAPPPPKSDWVAEPLPVTRTIGDVSFALTRVAIKDHAVQRWGWVRDFQPQTVDAKFAVTEDGKPSSNWLPLTTELFDSDGNFASEMNQTERFLCPRVPVWKYRVQFFGAEKSRAASNAVWVLRGLDVPGDGKFFLLNKTNELQGVPILIGTLAGPGKFTYSNGVAVSAEPPIDNPEETSLGRDQFRRNTANAFNWPRSWRGGRFAFGGAQPSYKVDARDVHLAFEIGELSDDQRFTARVVDEQGRAFYTRKMRWGGPGPSSSKPEKIKPEDYLNNGNPGEPPFLILDLPKDAKKLDLYFCVHTCCTAEFIFKPPQE
jgi:hypothetical protein